MYAFFQKHRVFFAVVVLLLLAAPAPAFAAVSFDSSQSCTVSVGSSPMNCSATNTAGNFAIIQTRSPNTSADSTAVTWNGVSATQMGTGVTTAGGNYTQCWYLSGAATGAHTLSINYSQGSLRASVAFYSGVNAIDATSSATAAATSITGTVVTTVNNDWIGACGMTDGTTAAGTNTTLRVADDSANGVIVDSNAAKTPAGSYSVQVTGGSTNNAEIITWSLSPTVAAATVAKVPDIITF